VHDYGGPWYDWMLMRYAMKRVFIVRRLYYRTIIIEKKNPQMHMCYDYQQTIIAAQIEKGT